jgi:hypothetical protein
MVSQSSSSSSPVTARRQPEIHGNDLEIPKDSKSQAINQWESICKLSKLQVAYNEICLMSIKILKHNIRPHA